MCPPDLKLPTSGDPPTVASQCAGITGSGNTCNWHVTLFDSILPTIEHLSKWESILSCPSDGWRETSWCDGCFLFCEASLQPQSAQLRAPCGHIRLGLGRPPSSCNCSSQLWQGRCWAQGERSLGCLEAKRRPHCRAAERPARPST